MLKDKEIDLLLKDVQECQKKYSLTSQDFKIHVIEKKKRSFSQSTYNTSISNLSDSSSISNKENSVQSNFAANDGESNNSLSVEKAIQVIDQSNQYQLDDIDSNSSRRISMMIKKKELLSKNMGSTANILYITSSCIYIANIGDSSSVMYANGVAVKMSEDHKTSLDSEKERILNAGLKIINNRVEGKLNLTRAFGKSY